MAAHYSNGVRIAAPAPFDHGYMRALFDCGYQRARRGYVWSKTPPI
jgi:hypothetical protein